MFFFQVNFISFVPWKANSTAKQQKLKDDEQRDRLLSSKVDLNFQISRGMKILPIDLVISILINFYQKSTKYNM